MPVFASSLADYLVTAVPIRTGPTKIERIRQRVAQSPHIFRMNSQIRSLGRDFIQSPDSEGSRLTTECFKHCKVTLNSCIRNVAQQHSLMVIVEKYLPQARNGKLIIPPVQPILCRR